MTKHTERDDLNTLTGAVNICADRE